MNEAVHFSILVCIALFKKAEPLQANKECTMLKCRWMGGMVAQSLPRHISQIAFASAPRLSSNSLRTHPRPILEPCMVAHGHSAGRIPSLPPPSCFASPSQHIPTAPLDLTRPLPLPRHLLLPLLQRLLPLPHHLPRRLPRAILNPRSPLRRVSRQVPQLHDRPDDAFDDVPDWVDDVREAFAEGLADGREGVVDLVAGEVAVFLGGGEEGCAACGSLAGGGALKVGGRKGGK